MRARLTPAAIATFVAAAAILLPAASATAALPCGTGSNPVVCENSKPGTPFDDWYSASAWGDIAGFTTKASVAPGETLGVIARPLWLLLAAVAVAVLGLWFFSGDKAPRPVPSSHSAASRTAAAVGRRPTACSRGRDFEAKQAMQAGGAVDVDLDR